MTEYVNYLPIFMIVIEPLLFILWHNLYFLFIKSIQIQVNAM